MKASSLAPLALQCKDQSSQKPAWLRPGCLEAAQLWVSLCQALLGAAWSWQSCLRLPGLKLAAWLLFYSRFLSLLVGGSLRAHWPWLSAWTTAAPWWNKPTKKNLAETTAAMCAMWLVSLIDSAMRSDSNGKGVAAKTFSFQFLSCECKTTATLSVSLVQMNLRPLVRSGQTPQRPFCADRDPHPKKYHWPCCWRFANWALNSFSTDAAVPLSLPLVLGGLPVVPLEAGWLTPCCSAVLAPLGWDDRPARSPPKPDWRAENTFEWKALHQKQTKGQATCSQLGFEHAFGRREHAQHDLSDNAVLDLGQMIFSEAETAVRHATQSARQGHVPIASSSVHHGSQVVTGQKLKAKAQRTAMPKHGLFSVELAVADSTMALCFPGGATTNGHPVLAKQSDFVLPTNAVAREKGQKKSLHPPSKKSSIHAFKAIDQSNLGLSNNTSPILFPKLVPL